MPEAMLLWLYNLVLMPILFPFLAWRLLVRGKSREGLAERFGKVPALGPAPPSGRVWVHAVSVGEMVAAAPVVAALRAALPGAAVLISTTTPTGQAQARRAFPDAALHFCFPFDLPWVTRRVLDRLQPSAIVLMEAEIWPNMLAAARQRGVPVVVANAHLSDRTLRRATRIRRLLTPLLADITRYLAQSAGVRDRALALGLPAERVVVAGHTKFDQQVPALTAVEAADLRRCFGLSAEQPLLLAGSTHPGEEERVLDAWEAARRAVPDLALMLAPRHLTRVGAVQALLERRGLAVIRRSGVPAFPSADRTHPTDRTGRTDPPDPNARTPECRNTVLLLDTMGELARFYGLASIAFVGGSLVPDVGGHDLLQPLFHGVPTLFGPHVHKQRALAGVVLGAGAACQVADAGEFGEALVRLLQTGEARSSLQSAAARLLAEHRGAAARCAAVVADLIRSDGQNAPRGSPAGVGELRDRPPAIRGARR